MNHVLIHTDGSCFPNPGPGAWAAVLEFSTHIREISGRASDVTTNNRMEIQAAIEALRFLPEPFMVDLYTDSQYLRTGAAEWSKGWAKRKWVRKGGVTVPNADLWQQIVELNAIHDISWHWVRGHADCRNNVRCDALAENARLTLGNGSVTLGNVC